MPIGVHPELRAQLSEHVVGVDEEEVHVEAHPE